MDLDQLLGLADKGGTLAFALVLLVLLLRGDLVPKYVVARLEKELEERRREDRDEERLAERSLSVTERTAILAADMVVDLMRNESSHRTRNRNRQDRQDAEDRDLERDRLPPPDRTDSPDRSDDRRESP